MLQPSLSTPIMISVNPKRQQHLCLPPFSVLDEYVRLRRKIPARHESSYTRCSSSGVVRQSLVVPTSDGSVLVEDLPPQTRIPRPPDLASCPCLSGPRRRHFPLQKKADMSKSRGVETRIWVKKSHIIFGAGVRNWSD